MLDRQEIFSDVGLSLGIGHWLVDLQKMIIHWPIGIGVKAKTPVYTWTSFNTVVASYAERERMRFMAYIEELVRNPGEDRILSISVNGEETITGPLRLTGRYVKEKGRDCIYGIVLATGHGLELENRAHSLSLVLDAVFYGSETGMVVLDDMLRITRANREAIEVLGVRNVDVPQRAIFAEMETRIPHDIRDQLMVALRQRATVSGTFRSKVTQFTYRWRATPWGKGAIGGRGVVVVFNRQPVQMNQPDSTADVSRLEVLEHVHIPVVVLKTSTAEIRFANQAARNVFHMKSDSKHFVRNLVDLCGRAVPPEAYEEVRRGGQFVNLKMGARLSKVDDVGEELLIEYGLG